MEPYQLLELEWSAFNNLDPAWMVACSSGTAALHLALEAFQLPQGSEVIVPDYTMVAVPRAVTLAGLVPRFVDCRHDLCIDPHKMVDEETNRDKDDPKRFLVRPIEAVIAVHTYGRRCDMQYLSEFREMRNGRPLIEDMAEAHGFPPGEGTDAACWSFYKNKIVAGEEGGAVWFRDPKHAVLARQLRSLGFTDGHDYTHVPRGHNYRLANCLADRIRASLRMADVNIKMRRIIEAWYDQVCPAEWRQPSRDAVWVYDFRVKGMTRETQTKVVRALQAAGIEARFGFYPMTRQLEYYEPSIDRAWSNAWTATSEVIYLPVTPFVTREEDCERAFDVVRRVLTEHS